MTFFDRRTFRHFDWISFALILVLSSLSLLFVFSATYTAEQPFSLFFKKQLFGIISGIALYALMCIIDHRSLERWGYILYFVTMGLLIFTIFKGSIGLGAQRWISLGLFKFQPSELAKLFFPAFFTYSLTGHISSKVGGDVHFTTFIPILLILTASCFFIIKQPDLGTGLIVLFMGGILLWLAGMNKKFFLIVGLIVLISAPIAINFLKPYQKKRILVFLGGGSSDRERYQIEQSQIAIGSGGLWGKGYLKGTQNRLNFLPESRTDFIFSVICEEWGFIGATCVILLYLLLFLRTLLVATYVNNVAMQLLALGLIIPSIVSTIINISMVIGLLPVVGIPLPFITYGITHLWISFASFGWFNGIIARRYIYQ